MPSRLERLAKDMARLCHKPAKYCLYMDMNLACPHFGDNEPRRCIDVTVERWLSVLTEKEDYFDTLCQELAMICCTDTVCPPFNSLRLLECCPGCQSNNCVSVKPENWKTYFQGDSNA